MNRQARGVIFRLLSPREAEQALRLKRPEIEIQLSGAAVYSLAEQWELSFFSRRVDLLHVPHFNIPVLGAKKLVVSVHDLIYLKGDEHSGSSLGRAYAEFMFKSIERKADAVIAVSQYTQQDLLEHFPKLKGRTFVTHEAASFLFQPVTAQGDLETAKKKYSLQRPFVLFVGSLKKHKNVPLLIEAVASIRRDKKIDLELVLVGRQDKKEKELLSMVQANRSFVRTLGQMSDEELVHLYNLAEVFVLPSLWEGFGLPALEAMACGTPVLASDRASLPEVVQDAAILFDPTRVDALKDALYNVLQNSELRQKMRRMGIEQAKKFSWERTASETFAVYERVLG